MENTNTFNNLQNAITCSNIFNFFAQQINNINNRQENVFTSILLGNPYDFMLDTTFDTPTSIKNMLKDQNTHPRIKALFKQHSNDDDELELQSMYNLVCDLISDTNIPIEKKQTILNELKTAVNKKQKDRSQVATAINVFMMLSTACISAVSIASTFGAFTMPGWASIVSISVIGAVLLTVIVTRIINIIKTTTAINNQNELTQLQNKAQSTQKLLLQQFQKNIETPHQELNQQMVQKYNQMQEHIQNLQNNIQQKDEQIKEKEQQYTETQKQLEEQQKIINQQKQNIENVMKNKQNNSNNKEHSELVNMCSMLQQQISQTQQMNNKLTADNQQQKSQIQQLQSILQQKNATINNLQTAFVATTTGDLNGAMQLNNLKNNHNKNIPSPTNLQNNKMNSYNPNDSKSNSNTNKKINQNKLTSANISTNNLFSNTAQIPIDLSNNISPQQENNINNNNTNQKPPFILQPIAKQMTNINKDQIKNDNPNTTNNTNNNIATKTNETSNDTEEQQKLMGDLLLKTLFAKKNTNNSQNNTNQKNTSNNNDMYNVKQKVIHNNNEIISQKSLNIKGDKNQNNL